jgi:glycosyltransferase involved in cell wall biosynthesis
METGSLITYVVSNLSFMQETLNNSIKNTPPLVQKARINVVYLSSYLPRKCGIATFTNDLLKSVDSINSNGSSEVIAMTDSDQIYMYPDEVKLEINQYSKSDYERAAEYINKSSADVVSLQHEFGLHTGPNSANACCLSAGAQYMPSSVIEEEHYLLSMVDAIKKPVVTTFHTVLPTPDIQQIYIVRRLIKQSVAIVVMSEAGRETLISVYDCPSEKIAIICHGVPSFEFEKTKKYRKKLGVDTDGPVILVAGLLGPGKGLEHVINAMPAIIKISPLAKLLIVGQTHPVILKNEGESYRNKLIKLIKDNMLFENVEFINHYLDDDDFQDYFQATDYFVTAYANMQQSTSGMLAWGLSAGKICISTPYQHAQELLSDGTGILVPQNSPSAIAKSVIGTLNNPEKAMQMRKKAYEKGREWIWDNVARDYLKLFSKFV